MAEFTYFSISPTEIVDALRNNVEGRRGLFGYLHDEDIDYAHLREELDDAMIRSV